MRPSPNSGRMPRCSTPRGRFSSSWVVPRKVSACSARPRPPSRAIRWSCCIWPTRISRRAAMPRREQPIVGPARLASPPPSSRPATARFSNGSRPTCGKRPRQEVDMSTCTNKPGPEVHRDRDACRGGRADGRAGRRARRMEPPLARSGRHVGGRPLGRGFSPPVRRMEAARRRRKDARRGPPRAALHRLYQPPLRESKTRPRSDGAA